MNSLKKRFSMQLLYNLAIVLLSIIGTYQHFLLYGFGMFRFYTVCSNVFLCLACIVFAYWNILCLMNKRRYTPTWIKCFKYFAVCTTTVTFLVVILVLTPMTVGDDTTYFQALTFYLFHGEMLYHHFLCPVLGIFSLIFVDNIVLKDKKFGILALIPTLLYAIILTVLNIESIVDGPYPFLRVHNQSLIVSLLWYIALFTLAHLIAAVLAIICNIKNRKLKENDESTLKEDMGYSKDGFIINQDCFHDITYRTIPASENGCGPVAIYNVCHANHQEVSFGEVIREMDLMHFLAVPGPTKLHVMRKYLTRYMPGYSEAKGRRNCLEKCLGCNKAILRYYEGQVPHFVAFIQVEGDLYRFFNVADGMEDMISTVDQFFHYHVKKPDVRVFYW